MDSHCVGEREGLIFCLARPEDYDDVMSISHGIYDGNDYLPHRYQQWMTEEHRVVILARRGKKLVALESGLVVDGGTAVIVEGLRVCPTERGCGVAGVIQRFVAEYIKQLYPSVKKTRLTREDPGPDKLSKFTVLAQRAVLSLRGSPESYGGFISHLTAKIYAESNSCPPLLTRQMDQDALKALLLDPDLPSRLQLPGGTIIQDWQPLELMESNLEVLARRNLSWFVDDFNEKPSFVSFHTSPYPVPFNGGSLRLNIDLFGTDAPLAKRALVAHLNSVKAEIKVMVLVHIYMHQTLWEDLRRFCEGHKGVTQWRSYWRQIFVEKDLP